MMNNSRPFRIFLATALVLCAGSVSAQEFEVLAAFDSPPAGPSGGLVVGPGGLFGVADGGAFDFGSVFRYTPPPAGAGGSMVVLHSFPDTENHLGKPRYGLTLASDGYFYGSRFGGGHGSGTAVYRVSPSGEENLVHQFSYPDDGWGVAGPLVEVDGALFGVCGAGGDEESGWAGTLFSITIGGDFKVLHTLSGGLGGAYPSGGLVYRPQDGFLYGSTIEGGDHDHGTIFRFHPVTGDFETLDSFEASVDGNGPRGEMAVGPDGRLYGATTYDRYDIDHCGRIFSFDPEGGDAGLSVIHNFSCEAGETKRPLGGMVVHSRSLYGVTIGRPSNVEFRSGQGSVYRLDLETGDFEILRLFPHESYHQGNLVVADDGYIYGQNREAGLAGADAGIVYRIDPDTDDVRIVWEFGPSKMPRRPYSVAEISPGALLGLSRLGGGANLGTAFRLGAGGEIEVLHNFVDGGTSSGGATAHLTRGSDGLFYGTRSNGGAEGTGSVFSLDAVGTYRELHSFERSDTHTYPALVPMGALLESRFEPGLFYGTLFGAGLYELGPDGMVTVTARVSIERGSPRGGLVQTDDGRLFGAIYWASSPFWGHQYGAVFVGGLSWIHEFKGRDGAYPTAGVTARPAGAGEGAFFYGTTEDGGTAYLGTIYKVSYDEEFFQLHSFTGPDGDEPMGEMVLAGDRVYGTTRKGGDHGYGTLFSIDPEDRIALIHHFDHSAGAYPDGPLFLGSDGNLYGATNSGGAAGGGGVVFRFNLAAVVSVDGPHEIDEGGTATITASADDPQGGPVSFDWDLDSDGVFDDGSGPAVDFTADMPDRDGDGDYKVSVRATDETGVTSFASTSVTVFNVAPQVSASPVQQSTSPGQPVGLEVNFIDPGPDTWTATVDWGDGTMESVDPASNPFELDHSYTAPGHFEVQVTVADDDGGTGSVLVTVDVGSVENTIEELIEEIRELIDDGDIRYSQGRSLIAELQVALWFLSFRGGESIAAVRIELFILKVERLLRNDQIEPELGDYLLERARLIMEMLT